MSILEHLTGESLLNKSKLLNKYPLLNNKGAVFVTLNIKETGKLRGCIGSILPQRSLLNDIIYNAKSAAFNDKRFDSVTINELDKLSIEISLLSKPQYINYENIEELKKRIIPGKHGVIIEKRMYRATFLPAVWEKLPDFDSFFNHLCRKAGLHENCLDCFPDIEIYTVKKFSDNG